MKRFELLSDSGSAFTYEAEDEEAAASMFIGGMLRGSESDGGTQEEWKKVCEENGWDSELKWTRVYYCCNCGKDGVYHKEENWPFCRYCKEEED